MGRVWVNHVIGRITQMQPKSNPIVWSIIYEAGLLHPTSLVVWPTANGVACAERGISMGDGNLHFAFCSSKTWHPHLLCAQFTM